MRKMPLDKRDITDSRLVLGCMGFGGAWDNSPITAEDEKKAERGIETALEVGIRMFDHADIYTRGKAEKVFGNWLKKNHDIREQIVIQSKCGIRFAEDNIPGRYDFSRDYILQSVDGILDRLGTDYLDILLLHRPDPLMEPEEVAEAFERLKESGKVRNFGVSNMNAGQMKLLQAYIGTPLVVNQLEMSVKKLDWVDQGVHVNQPAGRESHFAEGLLEHCMLHDIQIQAWSPLAKGIYSGGMEPVTEAEKSSAALVAKLAEEKGTTREAIVLGWLMRHPANIQPVIGTTDPERIKHCQDAVRQASLMTRDEWYSLYVTSRGHRLP
ncbi:aldo/keto reductase [Neobacillus notoginsengisoli]|uniref:Aldo/keto reductase n=1 Tax=Neobacillus notoginsengisoli TaxID=1578198 RepID=A0A417YPB8_9BACI|nr:aldo/keto reductase [Neobacillus notoginsengisoli]RHW35674.1 aldo/keto reductase [Neobacillus notoginsengisoli]